MGETINDLQEVFDASESGAGHRRLGEHEPGHGQAMAEFGIPKGYRGKRANSRTPRAASAAKKKMKARKARKMRKRHV